MLDKALKINDAASVLSIHRTHLYKLIRDGKISAFYITPGRRVILQSEIERYITSRKALVANHEANS